MYNENMNIHKASTLKALNKGISWKPIQKAKDNTEAERLPLN